MRDKSWKRMLKILTVTITIVRGDFLSNSDGPEHPECDVLSFTKEFTVVITIMLSRENVRKFEKEFGNLLTLTNRAGPRNR
jgi:hypothetical protein